MIHVSAPLRSEGAGAQVRRLFPSSQLRWPTTDPFLLLDEFFVESHAGFPDHPHRGFEIITYMLEGGLEHRDSLGNHVQAVTHHAMHFVTGSGVIHSEMPLGRARGLQLWVNLPRRLKGISPSLSLVTPDVFPLTNHGSVIIRHIASPDGPITLHTDVWYDDVTFSESTSYKWEVLTDATALIYVVSGGCTVNTSLILAEGEAAVVETEALTVSSNGPVRFVVLRGRCQHESVHFFGPFVD